METNKKLKKKIVLNRDGDEIVLNPDSKNDVKEAAAVLNIAQRTKRSIAMRRRLPKIKRARELAQKRMARSKTISKRSQRISRKYLKQRLVGKQGTSYSSLSPGSKMAIDTIVNKRQVAIQRLAKRLMPKVKRAELVRLRTGSITPSYNIKGITSSYNPVIDQISSVYTDIMERKMKGEDPCWDGYHMVGHKMKKGKKVPNCVPEEKCSTLSFKEYLNEKQLGKPFRTPGGPKKFAVYVKNPESGNEKKVTFGDPNLSIKRDSPERRKAFRARHNCDDPGPRTKARYWSCRQWRAGAKVEA